MTAVQPEPEKNLKRLQTAPIGQARPSPHEIFHFFLPREKNIYVYNLC